MSSQLPRLFSDQIAITSFSAEMTASDSVAGGLVVQDLITDQPTASLYEAKDRKTGEVFALKIAKHNSSDVARELALLKTVSHSAIVPVWEVKTEDSTALAMPYAFGGDLFSWIESHPLDEATVKGIIFNILRALAYLHSQQIWHRDVKPENILVMEHSLSPDCVVLADFGFARRFPDGVCANEFCGSLQYAAPELLRGAPYTEKVDIWALGITMFACLTSSLPFDYDPDETRREIMAGLPHLFDRPGLDVSEECRALMDWMLAPNPGHRPSAEEALDHPWFQEMWESKEVAGDGESEPGEVARWDSQSD
jgi:serine/threonine protein kinase